MVYWRSKFKKQLKAIASKNAFVTKIRNENILCIYKKILKTLKIKLFNFKILTI